MITVLVIAPEIAQEPARVHERDLRGSHSDPGSQRGRQAFEVVTVVGSTRIQRVLASGCGEEVLVLALKDL